MWQRNSCGDIPESTEDKKSQKIFRLAEPDSNVHKEVVYRPDATKNAAK